MTPKQRVLKRYPQARLVGWSGPAWCIYPGPVKMVRGKRTYYVLNNSLNLSDKTPQLAWAAAAKHPSVRRIGGKANG